MGRQLCVLTKEVVEEVSQWFPSQGRTCYPIISKPQTTPLTLADLEANDLGIQQSPETIHWSLPQRGGRETLFLLLFSCCLNLIKTKFSHHIYFCVCVHDTCVEVGGQWWGWILIFHLVSLGTQTHTAELNGKHPHLLNLGAPSLND